MAAIDHTFAEKNTDSTTTSISYVDVDGTDLTATIGSSHFITGKKYLLYVTAQGSVSGGNGLNVRTLHGSTAFAESVSSFSVSVRAVYMFQTIWTAVGAEGIKLQFSVSGGTGRLDQIAILALNLTDDLTENTDWFFAERSTDDALSTTPVDGASVTFTPGTASDWVVLTFSSIAYGGSSLSAISRIERSGEATSTTPSAQVQALNVTGPLALMRAYSLTNVSNTFKEVAACTGSGHTRVHSSIFALNLAKFKVTSIAYTDADTGTLGITNYGNLIQTLGITPTVTGDVWLLSYWGFDRAHTDDEPKSRIQVDNTDTPGTQTSDAYTLRISGSLAATDELPVMQHTLVNISNAAHTVDLDGSSTGNSSTPTGQHRALVALTMELATGAPPPDQDQHNPFVKILFRAA